jgi:phosphate transport system permease protein
MSIAIANKTVKQTSRAKSLLLWRKITNVGFWSFSLIGLVLIMTPLLWLLYDVIKSAAPNWHFSVLFAQTKGVGGGISNAIVGTLVIILGVGIFGTLVGVSTGIYIAEYARQRVSSILKLASETLAGIPSIVLGYVGYAALVVGLHLGFSLGAALVVLTLMVLPYIAKSTESALARVPTSYREAAFALGMTKTEALLKIILKPALGQIITGIIIALAIALGETAPLLYTAGWSAFYPKLSFSHSPVGYLTYVVWTYYNQPFKSARALSFDSALVLVVMVLFLIIIAKFVNAIFKRTMYEEVQTMSRSISKRVSKRL